MPSSRSWCVSSGHGPIKAPPLSARFPCTPNATPLQRASVNRHDGLCTSGIASHGYSITFAVALQHALLVRPSRRAHPLDQFFYYDVASSSLQYLRADSTRRVKMNFKAESWIWYGMTMSMVTLRLYEDESLLQPISNATELRHIAPPESCTSSPPCDSRWKTG